MIYNHFKRIIFNLLRLYFFSDPYYNFSQGSYFYRWNLHKAVPVDTSQWTCDKEGCVAFELSNFSTSCDCFGIYFFLIYMFVF
jgi:hypothetical protein